MSAIRLPSDQDASGRSFGPEELDALREVLDSGTLTATKGEFTKRFEAAVADMLGIEHVVACASGTSAQPKAHSHRTIKLPASLLPELTRHRKEQAEYRLRLGLGRDARDLVFTNRLGNVLNPTVLSVSFARAVTAAGITRISFHGLRHGHITSLLRKGVPVHVVSPGQAMRGRRSRSTPIHTCLAMRDAGAADGGYNPKAGAEVIRYQSGTK